MHWAKAKNIIIFILAVLNIFLAVNLYINNSSRLSTKEAAQNAIEILKSRSITVKCRVPVINGVPKRLNFVNDGYDPAVLAEKLLDKPEIKASDLEDNRIVANGSRQLQVLTSISFLYTDSNPGSSVDISKIKTMEKYAVDFLKKANLMPQSFYMDNYVKDADNNVKFVFIEKYGNNLIYDNYLEVTVTQKGVTRILGSHRAIKKAENVSQDNIMTAWQVILRNFTDNAETEITGVDFGYKEEPGNIDNMKASLEEPVWRIKVKGRNEPKYYNAFIGYEIK